MKFKIEDINNLSDSRQVIESKPNKFIIVFIYILLTLILIFFIWAWISEKEIVVNASGVVKSNDSVQTISNTVSGKVKSVRMKSGESVSKGSVLYEIESTNLEEERKQIDDKIEKLNVENKNLEKLKKCIQNNKNYFEDDGKEREYYYKFKSYELGKDISLVEKNNITNSKSDIKDEKSKLELLNKSILEEKNYNDKDSAYSSQYESYMNSKRIIQNKIEQLNSTKDELNEQIKSDDIKIKNIKQEEISGLEIIKSSIDEKNQQISQIDLEIKDNKEELKKLKNDTISQIKISIDKANQNIVNLDRNLKSINQTDDISQNKNKLLALSEIEEKININKESKEELDINKNKIERSIKECIIKSPINGKVNLNLNLHQGLILEKGTIVANIIPNSNSYKIDIMIPSKNIANINVNKCIKYSFESLPHSEYGFLEGKIERISPDSQRDDETGKTFFSGEGSLNSNLLYSNKGEKSYIKPGMLCEVKIITRHEKMLYFILETIGLKNK